MFALYNVNTTFTAIATGDNNWGLASGTEVNITSISVFADENGYCGITFAHNTLGERSDAVHNTTLLNDTVNVLCYSDTGVMQACIDAISDDAVLCKLLTDVYYSEQGMQASNSIHCDGHLQDGVTLDALKSAGFEIDE